MVSRAPSVVLIALRARLEELERVGDVRRCKEISQELERQAAEFCRKASQRDQCSGIARYLATYDGCMRLVEYLAVREGYRFGSSPHRAFRIASLALLDSIDDATIRQLTQARHGAKKCGHSVELAIASRLDLLFGELRRVAEDCGMASAAE